MFDLTQLTQFLPFLIPLFIIELVLALVALIHVLRHPRYKFGNMPVWIVIVLVAGIIGPVAYFLFGKSDEV